MRKTLLVSIAVLFLVSAVFAGDKGGKPILAVNEFKNETSASWWSSDVARDLAGMLTNELSSTGKFKVVERQKIGAILDEQDLAASGRISRSTGAKIGKITGAQYIVIATVSAFDSKTRETGGGLSFHGIGVGGKQEEAYMAIDLRVVNTTTGEVEFTRTVEARSTGGGVGVSVYRGGWGGHLSNYEKTPVGKAIRGCIMEITDYLGCVMVDKDSCVDEYNAKEQGRRDKTKKSINLY
ncbi:MAG TPA: CsgG/HfaB family protein [Thermoanaerobaculia bacterium]|nr:CsgG/HfaB family protein [Thermoanaerobaculia bacterium]